MQQFIFFTWITLISVTCSFGQMNTNAQKLRQQEKNLKGYSAMDNKQKLEACKEITGIWFDKGKLYINEIQFFPHRKSENMKYEDAGEVDLYQASQYSEQSKVIMDTIPPRKEFPPRKKYAQYGDIILDRNGGHGYLKYISEDGNTIIDQPRDGLLIFRHKYNRDYKLEYYDKQHNLLKSIDFRAINPYTKEKYPLFSEKIGFDAAGENIGRNIMDDTTYDYRTQVTEYRTQSYAYHQVSNRVNYADNKNKRVLVCFNLIPMAHDVVIGWESTIFVFDSLGNLTDKISGLKYDVSHPKITQDGKYLSFTYGRRMDADLTFLTKYEGVIIYDIKKNQIVYSEKSNVRGFDVIYSTFEAKKGLIFVKKNLQPSKIDESKPYLNYKFFDMTKRIKYSADVMFDELNRRNKVYDKSRGSEQYLELFDFEVTKF